jgi:hypothetical protein
MSRGIVTINLPVKLTTINVVLESEYMAQSSTKLGVRMHSYYRETETFFILCTRQMIIEQLKDSNSIQGRVRPYSTTSFSGSRNLRTHTIISAIAMDCCIIPNAGMPAFQSVFG